MKWGVKIAGFKALSFLPGGSNLYRWSQEHCTGSLVPTSQRVAQKISVGVQYFQQLRSLGLENRLLQGKHLDLGSGWHPTIPLLFYALGCPAQALADVVPVLTRETARETAATFLKVLPAANLPLPFQNDRLEFLRAYPWPAWPPRELGWEYHAPYMDWLRSAPASLDLVTSTQALLHVPRPVLGEIFSTVAQALKPGGVFMATIHLRDLFADSDPSITPYNHLRYSPAFWNRWVCSSLMSYNRLKAPDYRNLLEAAGLQSLVFEVEPGDLRQLARVPIHPSFAGYSPEELAARHLFFVVQKP